MKNTEKKDTTLYNEKAYQDYLINFMISHEESFVRVQNIVDENYFDDRLRPVLRMIKSHVGKYRSMPSGQQIAAMTGYAPEPLNINTSDVESFLDETEGFCRHRAIENVILNGPELIEKGQGGDLERQIKEAMQISLISDLGLSYFDNIKERIERRKDRSNYVSTGWKTMDRKLGGGFTRGSLNLFAGSSGCVVAGTKIRVVRPPNISTTRTYCEIDK